LAGIVVRLNGTGITGTEQHILDIAPSPFPEADTCPFRRHAPLPSAHRTDCHARQNSQVGDSSIAINGARIGIGARIAADPRRAASSARPPGQGAALPAIRRHRRRGFAAAAVRRSGV
jgi:hypothetical protein